MLFRVFPQSKMTFNDFEKRNFLRDVRVQHLLNTFLYKFGFDKKKKKTLNFNFERL